MQLFATPKALHKYSPGSRQRTLGKGFAIMIYPEGVAQEAEWPLYNPFGVDELVAFFSPRVRCRDPGLYCATPSA